MSIQAKEPTNIEKYVDKDGRLTIDGLLYFQLVIRTLQDHEDRLVVLEP